MNLKKVKYLSVLCLSVLCFHAHASVPSDTIRITPVIKKKKPYPVQPLVLSTSPTGLLYGGAFPFTSEYRFSAEICGSRKQSDRVSISYLSKNIIWGLLDLASGTSQQRTIKASGYRLQYTHKFYLVNHRHHSPFGFYVGPHVSYANAKIFLGLNRYYKDSYFDLRLFNANMIVGVQMGKPGRLTVDIYAGAGYKSNEFWYHATSYRILKLDDDYFGDFYKSHFNGIFEVNMGYSF
ncbi:MAG: hypothetical protein ACJ77K_02140 [Bacteroidia bacterium]